MRLSLRHDVFELEVMLMRRVDDDENSKEGARDDDDIQKENTAVL
jgi:hypothetical protein